MTPARNGNARDPETRQSFLTSRYADDTGLALMSGIQALVRLPFVQMRLDEAAGRRTACLITGYEGSPLAGYDMELARNQALLDAHRVVFKPGVNEELAATAVGGSQLANSRASASFDGVLGIWYGKAPGLDRATDAIRHGNLQGSDHRGGALLLVGDDPGTKSSSLPSASDHALVDLAIPTLYPGSVEEVVDFGLYAIALSRLTGLWTGLKLVVAVADAIGSVELGATERSRGIREFVEQARQEPRYQHVARSLVNNPLRLQLERELHTTRRAIALDMLARFPLHERFGATGDARIGIVTAGKTFFDVRQALTDMRLEDSRLRSAGVRLLKLGAVFPTVPDTLRQIAAGLDMIIVVEEKRGLLESALRESLYGVTDAPQIVGSHDETGAELFPEYGEMDVDDIRPRLQRVLAGAMPGLLPEVPESPRPRTSLTIVPRPKRTPYLCSGCPHSRSTPVPDGSIVGAGIGCHALVTRSPRTNLGETIGITQMGGEGAQWIGMEPFVADSHLFQNLGDGTLTHSGSLAIRAAVAAGSHITFKILYNSAVAMTGGQQPTGVMSVAALTKMLQAEGVRRTIVTTENPDRYRASDLASGTTVMGADRLIEAQEELRGCDGVTALIHDQECAAELRRKRKRGRAVTPTTRVVINERICEGCGDCGRKSNCLSVGPVSTEFGGKTQIHQESCNFDLACLQGHCPSFVTIQIDPSASRISKVVVPDLSAQSLPDPPTRRAGNFAMRVTGIGGTGVVTVSQIVAMAATLDGRHVIGLDQTGMAQKGGPVVSDLKISDRPLERAAKLARGECDLYLVADVLTGVESANLAAASVDRTTAVISTSKVVPGELVGQPFRPDPEMGMLIGEITAATSAEHAVTLDALAISNRLFDNDVSANLVLLGAAYQSGVLPVSAGRIEEAIERNAVAVHDNLQAFRRGRQAVAAPEDLSAVTGGERAADADVGRPSAEDQRLIATIPEASEELRRLLEIRVPDLVAYQNRDYARRYVEVVAAARAAEMRASIVGTAYSEAVARYLYKLMAYKDEYEVARLSLAVVTDRFAEAAVGRPGRASFNLLPPSLARFGLKRKVRLGGWFRLVFAVLHRLRGVRGTWLDPFGRHPLRRLERELITDYSALIERTSTKLDRNSLERAVEMASAPDLIRGFDHVKLEGVARYRERIAELRESSDRPPAPVAGP